LPIVGAATSNDGIQRVGNAISEFLKIDLDTFRAQRTATEAFAYLRLKAEAAGIFILIVGDLGSHHTRISLEAFRGFALADPVAPFIVINDQDSRAAWSFTLMHEMVHICLGQTGISGGGVDFGNEQFCNDVASEILLPAADLPALGITDATELVEAVGRINDFAQSRNLSRSMVAYKLFRAGEIGREMWSSLRSEFHRQWLEFRETQRREARDHEGGPTYYVVRRHRVGRALVDLVSRLTYSGTLTSTKAAKVLGVKPRNVFELLQTKA
jgi:Zn-dependent peptidase ImmA (M78 family)